MIAWSKAKRVVITIVAILLVLGGFSGLLLLDLRQAAAQAQPSTNPIDAAPKQVALSLSQNVNVKFVQIPAGRFLMGSPLGEKDRDPGEIQHEVTISKPFYMGVTPVTVDQWAVFVAETGHQNPDERGVPVDHRRQPPALPGTTWRSPGFDQTGDHPVVHVSYTDCTEFCSWLSKKSGKRVTLPTEAQWEYAARAGATTAYPWGDNPADGKGWANVSQKFFGWDDGFVHTSPVASFKPNAFGLYDMTGNVRQWCFDRFAEYTNAPAIDPIGPIHGIRYVARGGTFETDPASTRLAYRLHHPNPDRHFGALGFRIAIAAD